MDYLKLDVVVHACNPSTLGGSGRKVVKRSLVSKKGKKVRRKEGEKETERKEEEEKGKEGRKEGKVSDTG